MAKIYDVWSENPAENNQAAPVGAGESRLTFPLISDTFRQVMAAIKQLANVVANIGSLGGQDAGNVAITGGTIGPLVSIDAVAIKTSLLALGVIPTNLTGKRADGLTTLALQQLYDFANPVGMVKLWHNSGAGLVWPGCTATWIPLAGGSDRLIVSAGASTAIGGGAGTHAIVETQLSSQEDANHTHILGGITGGHALTPGEVPPLAQTGNGAPVGGGSLTNPTTSYSGAAGAVHFHDLPAHTGQIDNVHHHTVVFDQSRYGFLLAQRTA